MREISEGERRARLGVRQALAPGHGAPDVPSAARAVVGLHATDPATTMLSALARCPGATTGDVETVLYVDRTLVRVLAFRRTMFAVPTAFAPACWAGGSDTVARAERRRLATLLVGSGVTDDPEPWIDRAEALALEHLRAHDDVLPAELAAVHPMLATRLRLAVGTRYESTSGVASRLLGVLSAQGLVVRGRPRGSWTSTQFRWTATERWLPAVEPLDTLAATVVVARAWLHAHGPATPDDLQWWTGWTRTRMRAALAEIDTVDVTVDGRAALLLADDVEPVGSPTPWVALLPALDPAAMGWKHRDHLLGPHREQLYDVNGNAGPTVWADGRVIGGWAQRDDGEVVTRLLEDVGRETTEAVGARAAELTTMLGEVRLKPRARGWTPVEKALRDE